MHNTFGTLFTLTTFGEAHGAAIGGIVDGMPAGIDIDMGFIQSELNRRKPGQSKITTDRKEDDQVEMLSGIFEGNPLAHRSVLLCATKAIVRRTTRTSETCSDPRMLTTRIIKNMASEIIGEVDEARHASHWHVWWLERWPDSY